MSVDIRHIDLNDPKEIKAFYEIGNSIRNGSQKIEIPWTDSGRIEDVILDNSKDAAAFIAGSEDQKGRIFAFCTRTDQQGFIGWYECDDNTMLSATLLDKAEQWLKEQGCKSILGPINGCTWFNYRFNKTDNYPILPGEPYQPLYYVDQWKSAGYSDKYEYVSQIAPKDLHQPTTVEKVRQLLAQNGMTLHQFPEEPDEKFLRDHYDFYNTCFQKNPLFCKIPFEVFAKMSFEANKICNREHSWFIDNKDGFLVSLVISYNDIYHKLLKEKNKETKNRYKLHKLIIKTISTHPDYQGQKLGRLLVNLVHNLAAENNYDEIYHMLMYTENASQKKGRQLFKTKPARSYSLMEKWI